ncbi:MAG: hypothetical protein ACREAB_01570 [Blastocatellia bacterium]
MFRIQKQPSFAWGKVAGMFFAVFIPGGLVAYCNHIVFPESSYIAIGMVVVSVGIAAIFTIASAYATPNVRRYCLLALLFLAVVVSINLSAHWVLSREASGAKQATSERHAEEDRMLDQWKTQVDGAAKLAEAQRDMARAEERRLNAEAWRNNTARRLGVQAPRGSSVSSSSAPIAMPSIEAPALATKEREGRLTLEQVMKKWSGWLIGLAILDLLASVVSFGICATVWEWDRDGDGVADHLQKDQTWPAELGK